MSEIILSRYHVIFVFISIFSTTLVKAHYTDVIDMRCNVHVNSSASERLDREQLEYDSCLNATVKDKKANLDKNKQEEAWDCFWKCSLQRLGVFLEDGKHNSAAIQQYYENNSNATSEYITKIVALHEACFVRSTRKVEALKRNGTVSDCKVFGLYDSCMFQAASATNVASKFCDVADIEPTDGEDDDDDTEKDDDQDDGDVESNTVGEDSDGDDFEDEGGNDDEDDD